MNHRLLLITGATALAATACGSASSASTGTGTPGASASAGAANRGGVFGELVQITGTQLVLSAQTGDVNVAISSTTTASKSETGALGDLTVGQCITATGPRSDSSAPSSTPGAGAAAALPAAVSATTVTVRPPVGGSCAVTGVPGTGNPAPPRSGAPPSGTGAVNRLNLVFATGQITAVKGSVLSVHSTLGNQTVTVANGAVITKLTPETTADLAVGDCITAAGQRDANGTVQARTLTVSQPTATGCVASGRGFGFGGGGRGGNAGGNGGGAPGSAATPAT